MKEPETMTIAELRAELARDGRDRAARRRSSCAKWARPSAASNRRRSGRHGKYDPLRAQLFVLKAHGMTNADLPLNRKGKLFIALTTRERERSPPPIGVSGLFEKRCAHASSRR